MEDTATAEIARARLWQWTRHRLISREELRGPWTPSPRLWPGSSPGRGCQRLVMSSKGRSPCVTCLPSSPPRRIGVTSSAVRWCPREFAQRPYGRYLAYERP
ncbi:hypothetical protein [Streptomyces roseus]|uniref:hypothetical protein n=1 Tax=Streptomyces roseus TaxID=66430 RepID=UPI001FD83DCA|nr:hypothetical protein [Streptomyces roseus]